jgi:hypothetical protein
MGDPVSYKKKYMREHYVTRKLRRDIYSRLGELCGGLGLNECLEKLLEIAERLGESISTVDMGFISTVDMEAQSKPRIRVERREDPFWLDVVVGEGYNTEHIALNIIQYEKLCRTGLLSRTLCESPK